MENNEKNQAQELDQIMNIFKREEETDEEAKKRGFDQKSYDLAEQLNEIMNRDKKVKPANGIKQGEKLFEGGIDDPDTVTYLAQLERDRKTKELLNGNTIQHEIKNPRQEERERLKAEQEMLRIKSLYKFKRSIAKILIFTSLLGAGHHLATDAIPYIRDKKVTTESIEELIEDAKRNLLICGLAERKDDDIVIKHNSANEYNLLNADTPMEVYIYELAINNNEEFTKFIRSVSYNDGTQSCYYESFEQFLRINGYYEQSKDKDGNVVNTESEEVFNNIMKDTILNAYNNNTLSSYEDEFYSFNIDTQNKTR